MWMLAATQSCHVDLYLIHLYLAFSLCSLYIYIYIPFSLKPTVFIRRIIIIYKRVYRIARTDDGASREQEEGLRGGGGFPSLFLAHETH